MARGKYAARAAKRRADSAEDQLDRLLPKLVDAQHTARHYKTEAEAAPVLRRQLDELRDTVGVPVAEHRQAIVDLETSFDEERATITAALIIVFDEMTGWLDKAQRKVKWSARMLDALRALPRDAADALLSDMGYSREERRFYLDPTTARRGAAANYEESMIAAGAAVAHGYKWDQIPAGLLSPTVDRQHNDDGTITDIVPSRRKPRTVHIRRLPAQRRDEPAGHG